MLTKALEPKRLGRVGGDWYRFSEQVCSQMRHYNGVLFAMSEQTIQSHDIKVADVFQAFYAVPDYQREYVWQTDQVEQLLNDINGELNGADIARAPEYFIGSIVVCPGTEGVLELIDGQQRMTTLFIVLCAIRDRIRLLGKEPPGALEPQIAATSTDAYGRDVFRYRLDLQYPDSGDVLEQIAQGRRRNAADVATRSIANIWNAYDAAMAFLTREFRDDDALLRVFYAYLTNRVKLIRIQTEDVAKALKIFETINDRGVGLNSMDLLKNLLFMKANREKFDELKSAWKRLQDTLFAMGEKPLRFLRYFILSHYDVDILREDEIYGWFSRNEATCGYALDPLGFADKLLDAAEAYRSFLSGNDHHGRRNRYLQNMQILGGKAARQHLILLLAGRHLSDALFDRLAREVEDLLFVYVITREQTRDFERNFARWAAELRHVSSAAELDDLIVRRFVPSKDALSVRFDDAFARLYGDSVQQYRLRYLLAKLTQYVELQAFGESEATKWLERYTGGGFDIEHIFPQKPSDGAVDEFGSCGDPDISNRLGNLTLVEQSINSSLGNRPYSQKRPVYKESRLLLTRSIAERPKIGNNTRIDIAVADLEPYPEWDEAAVGLRQARMSALARLTWNMPEP